MSLLGILIFACNDTKTDDTSISNDVVTEDTAQEGNTENTETENTETEETETEETETENTEIDNCADLSVEECGGYSECETVYAQLSSYNEDASCTEYGTSEPIACEFRGCSSEPTITFAQPTGSQDCWMIPSGCLPQGWEICGANGTQDCP